MKHDKAFVNVKYFDFVPRGILWLVNKLMAVSMKF